jgi:hypothetical protein
MPLILVQAHESISQYGGPSGWQCDPVPEYFKDPAVWKDIQTVYERCLAFGSKNPEPLRARYARLACWAEQWKVAAEQFEKLGERPRQLGPFKDLGEYERWRSLALSRSR